MLLDVTLTITTVIDKKENYFLEIRNSQINRCKINYNSLRMNYVFNFAEEENDSKYGQFWKRFICLELKKFRFVPCYVRCFPCVLTGSIEALRILIFGEEKELSILRTPTRRICFNELSEIVYR